MRPHATVETRESRVESSAPAVSVHAAATLLAPHLAPSRLVRAESLSARAGVDVYLKLESDLPTGSFKVRGALYALARRLERGPVSEVVAASTGNHGAAVAYAARRLGTRARIFLPARANPAKVARIRALGAELTEAGETLSEAIAAAEAHAGRTGAHLLADAVDADVPVGAGTIALELLDQLPEPGAVLVPVGDTALIRGVASVLKSRRPDTHVVGVQAAGAPAYHRSWATGDVVATRSADTIADGLATTHPVEANVRAIRALVDEMRLVTDEAMVDAIALLLYEEHLVAEPAAAAPVAALLADPAPRANTVVVLTGSNVAPDVLERAARGPAGRPPRTGVVSTA